MWQFVYEPLPYAVTFSCCCRKPLTIRYIHHTNQAMSVFLPFHSSPLFAWVSSQKMVDLANARHESLSPCRMLHGSVSLPLANLRVQDTDAGSLSYGFVIFQIQASVSCGQLTFFDFYLHIAICVWSNIPLTRFTVSSFFLSTIFA